MEIPKNTYQFEITNDHAIIKNLISPYELINDYGIIEGTIDSHLLYVKTIDPNNHEYKYWLLTLYNNKVYCFYFSTDVISTIDIYYYMDEKSHIHLFKDEDESKGRTNINGVIPFSNIYYNTFIDIYNDLVNTTEYILK